MYKTMICNIRRKRPLIHCISNHVTANDCANILLAAGASPIMAGAPDEASEITSLCSGLVLNMGVPDRDKVKAMLISGAEANRRKIPVVFDPVGVGSSAFRRESAARIMENVALSVIRGNAGEIRALLEGGMTCGGVDSNISAVPDICRSLARKTGAVVICTGEDDIVTDGETCARISGGSGMMRLITGAGCQLSTLTGAFIAANPDDIFIASVAAAWTMKHCGKAAAERMTALDGNASCRNYVIDAVYNLTGTEAMEYEILI